MTRKSNISQITLSLLEPQAPESPGTKVQAPADPDSGWSLVRWREINIPAWRRILQESITEGDRRRENYARWMLREVLKDSEYKEEEACGHK